MIDLSVSPNVWGHAVGLLWHLSLLSVVAVPQPQQHSLLVLVLTGMSSVVIFPPPSLCNNSKQQQGWMLLESSNCWQQERKQTSSTIWCFWLLAEWLTLLLCVCVVYHNVGRSCVNACQDCRQPKPELKWREKGIPLEKCGQNLLIWAYSNTV